MEKSHWYRQIYGKGSGSTTLKAKTKVKKQK